VFLVEFVSLARTRVGDALVHFLAALTGGDGNPTVSGRIIVLNAVLICGADERVVWR
jgi:hypothetical protein